MRCANCNHLLTLAYTKRGKEKYRHNSNTYNDCCNVPLSTDGYGYIKFCPCEKPLMVKEDLNG